MRDINPSRLRGIVLYECKMRLRSWAYVIVFVLSVALALVMPTPLNYPGPNDAPCFALDGWRAGQAFGGVGLMIPLLAIFIVADRIVRDRSLRVKELIQARPVRDAEYVLGKYFGTFLVLMLIALAIFVGTPVVKYLTSGMGMDLVPLIAAGTLFAFPIMMTTVVTLAGATLIKSPRLFYAIYGIYWYWSMSSVRESHSLRTILDISGTVPLEAFFSSGVTCKGKPLPIDLEIVASNVLFIFATTVFLLIALTHLEKRQRSA